MARLTEDKLDALDADELDTLLIDLSNERAELRSYQVLVTSVYDRKAAERDARLRIESMTDDQKAALAQVLAADGARSEERGGKLGKG